MGLINKAITTLENGVEISNTYISIERLKIKKNLKVVDEQPDEVYGIYNKMTQHVSREKKYEDKPEIDSLSVDFGLAELPSTMEELYANAYSEIKIFYPDTVDVIE